MALCLGSAKHVVWVDQTDAAAFSEGTHLFLPRPTGVQGEQDLLMALAMREVARIQHSQAQAFEAADDPLALTAASLEEARIKEAISAEYKGARVLFESATALTHSALLEQSSSPEGREAINAAIWASANDAYLGSTTSSGLLDALASRARDAIDPFILGKVLGASQAAPGLSTTSAAIKCAAKINSMLVTERNEPEPSKEQSADPQQEQNSATPAEPQGSEQEEQFQPPSPPEQNHDAVAEASDTQQPEPEGQGDLSEPQGPDVPSDEAHGDPGSESGSGQPTSGEAPDPSQTPAADAGTSENSSSEADASDGTPVFDPLSNALAKLRGHSGAKLRKPSHPVDESLVPEAEQAMLDSVQAAMQSDDPTHLIAQMLEQGTADDKDVSDEASGTNALSAADVEPQPEADDDAPVVIDFPDVMSLPESLGDHDLGSMPSRLVGVLLREFQTTRPRKSHRCESGRDVDARSLWRLKRLGDTKVFRQKSRTTGVDAAVSILLDRSTSMADDIGLAVSAAHAFASALQRISGVQTSLNIFPAHESFTETLLKYRQNAAQVVSKLKSVVAFGLTPLGQAIDEVLPALMRAGADKSVLLIITDGKPSNSERAARAIREAQEAGVEVLGIGITANARINDLIPNGSVTITAVSELPDALQQLFRTRLNACLTAV